MSCRTLCGRCGLCLLPIAHTSHHVRFFSRSPQDLDDRGSQAGSGGRSLNNPAVRRRTECLKRPLTPADHHRCATIRLPVRVYLPTAPLGYARRLRAHHLPSGDRSPPRRRRRLLHAAAISHDQWSRRWGGGAANDGHIKDWRRHRPPRHPRRAAPRSAAGTGSIGDVVGRAGGGGALEP